MTGYAYAKDTGDGRYELVIPHDDRFQAVLPQFISAHYLDPIDPGQTYTGEQAHIIQLAVTLNAMANQNPEGAVTGRTVVLNERPVWRVPIPKIQIQFKPMTLVLPKITVGRMMSEVLSVMGVLGCLIAVVAVISFAIYSLNSTSLGVVGGNGKFHLFPGNKIVVHVDIDHQYEVFNWRNKGVEIPSGCSWTEHEGDATVACRHPKGVVHILTVPEFRTFRKGDILNGSIMDYPATVILMTALDK